MKPTSFGPKKSGYKGGKGFGSKPAFGAKKSYGTKPGFGGGKSYGTGKSYGAAKPYARPSRPGAGFSDRGDRPVEVHDAICGVCGKPCRVPFRPNGSKPVLCTNCFKKDRGAETTYSGRRSSNEFGGDQQVPGAFGRPKFAGKYAAPSARSYGENNKIETRLATIESKLDMILKKLGASGAKAALGEDEFSL
jgi:CxxC-x17-CxxC domain-containing protein